jgi:hypothetical protein
LPGAEITSERSRTTSAERTPDEATETAIDDCRISTDDAPKQANLGQFRDFSLGQNGYEEIFCFEVHNSIPFLLIVVHVENRQSNSSADRADDARPLKV